VDPRQDPYTPGAGARPPELAGRDSELDAFEVLLDRLEQGQTGQSLMLTGWRGMGKTVLLERLEWQAQQRGWATVDAEIADGAPFPPKMAQLARRALVSIAPESRWKEAGRRAAAVVQSFRLSVSPDGSVTAGLDVDAARGLADSGVLEDDLTEVLVGLGQAAAEQGTGVVVLLDELQNLPQEELSALLTALHKTVQRQLPLALVAAGLPRLRKQAGDAQSYAERMFRFPLLDVLPPAAAAAALAVPAEGLGVAWEPAALDAAVAWTGGYPYFLQELGSAAWAAAPGPPITAGDVRAAVSAVEDKLDQGFFATRVARATPVEVAFLRAMAAASDDGTCPVAEVASTLHKSVSQVAPTRASLLRKGLVRVPEPGTVAFTVPRFAAHLRRT
jgi:hypothetical protein